MLRLLRRVRDSASVRGIENEQEEINFLSSDVRNSGKQVEQWRELKGLLELGKGAASTRVFPHDLSVHYVESTSEGTRFTRLRVSEDGDFLDEWPDGFFDERDEELF